MGEMVIIAGVALVVIGPERFPEFAKIVLRTVRDLRGYVDEAKRDISKELKPVQKEIEKLSRYNPEDYIDSLTGAVTGDDKKSDAQKAAHSEALDTATGTDPYGRAQDDLDGEYKPYENTEPQATAGESDAADEQTVSAQEGAPDPYYDTGDSESHPREAEESSSESDTPERLDG